MGTWCTAAKEAEVAERNRRHATADLDRKCRRLRKQVMDSESRELLLRVLRRLEWESLENATGDWAGDRCGYGCDGSDGIHAPGCELAAAIRMLQPVEVADEHPDYSVTDALTGGWADG